MGNYIWDIIEATLNSEYDILFFLFCIIFVFWRAHVQKIILEKTYDIKKSKFSILMQYVEEVLLDIEETCVSNVEKILSNVSTMCHCSYATKYPDTQLLIYTLAITNSLFIDLRSRIKLKLQENGFHNKTGPDLEKYIVDTATILLHGNRTLLRQKVELGAPDLKNKDDERFPLSGAIEAYRKIVYKAIEIKKVECEQIKELEQQYNILPNINKIKEMFRKS